MSDQSVARRVQRATGVRYTTALMWVRDEKLREEAGKKYRFNGGSFADKLADVCIKHFKENVMAKKDNVESKPKVAVATGEGATLTQHEQAEQAEALGAPDAAQVRAAAEKTEPPTKKPIVGKCIVCTSPVTEDARCFGCDEYVCFTCRRNTRHKLPATHNPEAHGQAQKVEVK